MNSPPKILYKYLDAEGAIKTLENCKLKFSSPLSLNDPFEFRYGPISEESKADLYKELYNARTFRRRWVEICDRRLGIDDEDEALKLFALTEFNDCFDLLFQKIIDEMQDRFIKMHEEFLYFTAMTCFSSKWNDLLMWGHYADKHKGVVIGFDTQDLSCQVGTPRKVNYNPENKRVPMPSSVNNVRFQSQEAMTRKPFEWAYEDEWRIIANVPDLSCNGGMLCHSFRPTVVKEIYVGMRADDYLKQNLIHFWRAPGVTCKFFFICPSSSEFNLDREEFSTRMMNIASGKS